MRRVLVVFLAALAIVGVLAPQVMAQTPKVTIVGLFDQVTSAGANFYDGQFYRKGDNEWYARTRFRPDFIFEVGRTKAVLGLEFDITYGQTGNCGAGPGKVAPVAGTGICSAEKAGSTASAGLNTDVAGIAEVKWAYTQFDLTGKDSLLPFIPVLTQMNLGLQPFLSYGGLVGTYRATYAQGDFAGLSTQTTWAPNFKTGIAYVMIEDTLGGFNRSGFVGGLSAANKVTRGDDFAMIFNADVTPLAGLDIKPIYSFAYFSGTTSSQARRAATNITTAAGPAAAPVLAGNIAGAGAYQNGLGNAGAARYLNGDPSEHETRHTIGFDARWRSGPFSLDPTFLYQFGTRNNVLYDNPGTASAYRGHSVAGDINSFLVDIQGGWQIGPLLLEMRGMYTSGNKARDNIGRHMKYFEPLDLDTGYWAGWASIWGLGIDYFNGGGGNNGFMSTNIGYDRYGRGGFGIRTTYNITPALSVYGIVSPMWTAEKVDTDTVINAAGFRGCNPGTLGGAARDCFVKGDSSYLGTEGDIGLTWRFAPNTTFDMLGAYLWAGDAMKGQQPCTGANALSGCFIKEDAHNAWTTAARVRFAF